MSLAARANSVLPHGLPASRSFLPLVVDWLRSTLSGDSASNEFAIRMLEGI